MNLFGDSDSVVDNSAALLEENKHKMVEVLYSTLSRISLHDFVRMLTNEVDATLAYYNLLQGEKDGQKISLLFNPHRLNTRTCDSLSIYESLQNKKFITGLTRALLFKKGKSKELLYQAIQIGINGVQYVNEFPPHVMKQLCESTNAENVLDPCAGWGGRMIGASACCKSYTAYEPSTQTYKGLCDLQKWLGIYSHCTVKLYNLPFEKYQDNGERYDLIMTSPPYYDTELYANEETQASTYASFDDYVAYFYKPMLLRCMRLLKPCKSAIFNVGSRRYPLGKVLQEVLSEYKIIRRTHLLASGEGMRNGDKEGEVFYEIVNK